MSDSKIEQSTSINNPDSTVAQKSQEQLDKDLLKARLREEAQKIKIRQVEGPYTFDNPHLEHKTKRQKKLEELEEKYKDKPKIAFHTLTDEGNLKFMQIKRDMIWTTLGWSFLGNFAGILAVQYIEKKSDKWRNLRHVTRRETMKVLAFLGTVAAFTYYGYGRARQEFVREKLKIVEQYSISSTTK